MWFLFWRTETCSNFKSNSKKLTCLALNCFYNFWWVCHFIYSLCPSCIGFCRQWWYTVVWQLVLVPKETAVVRGLPSVLHVDLRGGPCVSSYNLLDVPFVVVFIHSAYSFSMYQRSALSGARLDLDLGRQRWVRRSPSGCGLSLSGLWGPGHTPTHNAAKEVCLKCRGARRKEITLPGRVGR